MYYVVQEKVFKEENYENLINSLNRLGLEYEIVQVLPFVEQFEVKTDRKDVFPFGAVKMSRLSKKYNWYPGSQWGENHDYEVYSKYYKDNLLNYDSKIINFGDESFFSEKLFFARPTEDTKVFTGRVFDMNEWREFRELKLTDGHTTLLNKGTKIQISSVKNIQKEIRFWIVKGKIATASVYNMGGVYYTSSVVDDDAYEFVNNMIQLFQLTETFTMDICLTNGQHKIVECGCTSSAGFYKADINKLLICLEEAFSN